MKVWGTDHWDNELAVAFREEWEQDGQWALEEAFSLAEELAEDFLPAEEGHRVLAAADLVHTERLISLVPAAERAVLVVLSPASELPDLWEGDEKQEWLVRVEALLESLRLLQD